MANRSGREGAFLKASERESLLRQFARFERRKRQIVVNHLDPKEPMKDGCRVCEKDNDHSNMLLCERCSAEYHFYCIGLKTVPTEDWFCGTLCLCGTIVTIFIGAPICPQPSKRDEAHTSSNVNTMANLLIPYSIPQTTANPTQKAKAMDWN